MVIRKREIRDALGVGIPIFIGYFPAAVAFGILAAGNGLGLWETFLFSALVFAGVLTATPDCPWADLIGLGFTLLYGLFRDGIIVPVLGSVAVTCWILYLVLVLMAGGLVAPGRLVGVEVNGDGKICL